MKWHRLRPGAYWSGPYTVTEVAEGWAVTGPGLTTRGDCLWDTKRAAQDAAYRAMMGRLSGDGRIVCEPVVGDAVEAEGQRRGTLAAVLTGGGHGTTYCIRFPRDKRLVLFRGEFLVVLP